MSKFTRRDFIKLAGITGGASALGVMGLSSQVLAMGKSKARVVIIGGGFGGATAAKYIRMMDPSIEVTLIERDVKYHTCPFSNTVLAGINNIDYIAHSYDKLQSIHGVNVIHDSAQAVDPVSKTVKLAGGKTLKYDRLIMSPGIDFKWNEIEGYDESASLIMPHSWKAGSQTLLLRKQLESMKDGGVFAIAPPANPFRCPPGPYERVSMVAHYLKKNKPKSKILILDAKEKFSKQGLFTQGWKKLYPGMIEWVSLSKGGEVKSIDTKNMILQTEFDKHKVDVANVIPPQKAGMIAFAAGLTNKHGWCPVNQKTFESTVHAGIHVIGDSSIAGKMPKSGFSANSQGKVCAAAVVAMLNGKEVEDPSFINTCYSLVGPLYGISVAAVYQLENGSIAKVKGSGGVTPSDASKRDLYKEAKFAEGWYKNITSDMFG